MMLITSNVRPCSWQHVSTTYRDVFILLPCLLIASTAIGQEFTPPTAVCEKPTTSEHAISLNSLDQEVNETGTKVAVEIYETAHVIDQGGDSNERRTLDKSSRISFFKQAGTVGTQQLMGIDFHKAASDNNDVLRWVLNAYATIVKDESTDFAS